MNAKLSLTIATLTAALPMAAGSLIFWAWFFYPLSIFELWGLYTIIISIPICITGLLLAWVISKSKSEQALRKKANTIIYLILFNIPVCICYIWAVFYLMDTERITIVNNTDSDITDINIFGAGENDSIDKLAKGDSKTVWIHMTHESAIEITYKENAQLKRELINGYTGPGMGGHRYDYFINSKEEKHDN